MSAELGKIEKPQVTDFKKGRRLYLVPLIYKGQSASQDFLEKFDKYWRQVEEHLNELEMKLGPAQKIYHELIPVAGEEGLEMLKGLNDKSYQVSEKRVKTGSQIESLEDDEILAEYMDWSRCLTIGLQSQKAVETIYHAYIDTGKKRNEFIARRIDETLKEDETGILFMGEGHQVQFPATVEVFYVSPPALDEINRWLRDRKSPEPEKPAEKQPGEEKPESQA
jgi:hypothetical protein